MENTPSIAYRISRDFSNLYCDVHHLSLSTRNSKENTVVKVCCPYFKYEVEKALQNKFGNDLAAVNIRFQLPQADISGINSGGAVPEE